MMRHVHEIIPQDMVMQNDFDPTLYMTQEAETLDSINQVSYRCAGFTFGPCCQRNLPILLTPYLLVINSYRVLE